MTGWAILLVCALGADETGWRSNAATRRSPAATQQHDVRPASATSAFSPEGDFVDDLVDRAGQALQDAAQTAGQEIDRRGGVGNMLERSGGRFQDQLDAGARWLDDAIHSDVNGQSSRFDVNGSSTGRSGRATSAARSHGDNPFWDDFADTLNIPLRDLPPSSRTGTSLVQRIRVSDARDEAPLPPLVRGERVARSNSVSTSRRNPIENLPANRWDEEDQLTQYDDLPVRTDVDSGWLQEEPSGGRMAGSRGFADDRVQNETRGSYRSRYQDSVADSGQVRTASRRQVELPSELEADDAIPARMAQARRRTLEEAAARARGRRNDLTETRLAANESRQYIPPLDDNFDVDTTRRNSSGDLDFDNFDEAAPQRGAAGSVEDSLEGDSPSDGVQRLLASRPWWPLTLAIIGLFASICFNIYLGWIAWDLYTRYQDAIADVQELETRLENQQFEQGTDSGSSRRLSRAAAL
ncbi:MAG: hypothetical protein KDB23_10770 [Planctomycetales bacterium]|nr:hypothetical protein [Planctomycetales bacterium]